MEKNYFSENIYYLRKKARMTQTEFGKQLDLSKSCISSYELGTRSPILDDVFKLADFFNVRVADLLTVDLENSPGFFIAHTEDLKEFSDDDVELIASIIKALKKK